MWLRHWYITSDRVVIYIVALKFPDYIRENNFAEGLIER